MGRHSSKRHWLSNAHRNDPAMKLQACVNGEMHGRKRPSVAVKAAAIIIIGIIIVIIVIATF